MIILSIVCWFFFLFFSIIPIRNTTDNESENITYLLFLFPEMKLCVRSLSEIPTLNIKDNSEVGVLVV